MSSQVFPALPGVAFPVKRTPQWSSRKQVSVSGKETAIANWSYPRWQWELSYEFLRQGSIAGAPGTEFAQLAGFFNARQGGYDSFLYTDADDHAVAGQGIGIGDGSTVSFQLVRALGNFVEPILAPNAVGAVYLNGVPQPSGWSVSPWGSATPGLVTFAVAPGVGVVVTADFSYYWPCRFTDDAMDFEKFMAALYQAKSVKFVSLK